MNVSAIPLSVIEDAFFRHYEYDDGECLRADSSYLTMSEPEVMNDYTVIRLGDVPRPQPTEIPKYPKFKKKAIDPDIPGVFYGRKMPPPFIPEYAPPPRSAPRKVDRSKLSDAQKRMYGKSPYAQSRLIMEDKRKIIKYNCTYVDQNKILPKENVKVPRIFQTTYDQVLKDRAAEEKKQAELTEKKVRDKEREEMRAERDKTRFKQIKELRNEERRLHKERDEAEIEYQEIQKQRLYEERSKNWNPGQHTRASRLKSESSRRRIEIRGVEERREILNEEMRTGRVKEQAKRLTATLEKLRPVEHSRAGLDRKKKELRAKELWWANWLQLTENEMENKQLMLERLTQEDAFDEQWKGSGATDREPDANTMQV